MICRSRKTFLSGLTPGEQGFVDWRTMNSRATDLLANCIDPAIDPRQPMRELSVARKHLVQIARALASKARIVIMDEPTAALSHHEAEELLQIVRQLQDPGTRRAVHQSQV